MRKDQLKSGGSFRERQYCVYEPQKQPKNPSSSLKNGIQFCVAENVDIAWLLEPRILADGFYFSLCSSPWKLKVIRDVTRKHCWIFEPNDWYCSDTINHKLWTPPSTEGPLAKEVVDEMQWTPAISLNTNTGIKRIVRLYRQKVQIFQCS